MGVDIIRMIAAMQVVVTLLVAAASNGRAQSPEQLTPADTVHTDFSGFPQLVFPSQPALSAALDPRRQLSLQQQTHILTDIQQHHQRFFQQPNQQPHLPPSSVGGSLLFSQQAQVGATAPSAPLRETEPIFTPQAGQFVRFHAQAVPPQPSFGARPSAFAPRPPHHNQPHPLAALAPIAPLQPSAAAAAAAEHPLLHNSLQGSSLNASSGEQRSLRRGPGAAGAVGDAVPAPSPRPRARSEDGGVPTQQLFLPDERQRLFDQIRDYQQPNRPLFQQQAQVTSSFLAAEHRASTAAPALEPQREETLDNGLKQKINPLRQQQQQQELQAQLQKQFQLQLAQRQELIRQLKQALANTPAPTHRDNVLPHPSAPGVRLGSNETGPIFLANGHQLHVIDQSSDRASSAQNSVSARSTAAVVLPPTVTHSPTVPVLPTVLPTTPSAPVPHAKAPKALFEELTKGVLPPGAQFEVIRHKQDGELEEVNKLPTNLPDKKVTFVFLEEQPDGTVKVQGIRGSDTATKNSSSPVDIESIIKNINEGNIKLPISNKLPNLPTPIPAVASTPQATILSPTFLPKNYGERSTPPPRSNSILPTVTSITKAENTYFQYLSTTSTTTQAPPPPPPPPTVNLGPFSADIKHTESFLSSPSSQPAYNTRNIVQNTNAALPAYSKPSQDSPRAVNRPTSPPRSTTTARPPLLRSSTTRKPHFSPTPLPTAPPSLILNSALPSEPPSPSSTPHPPPAASSETTAAAAAAATSSTATASPASAPAGVLTQVLKKEGLFAMAKFLKDSALDSILNDTGPYTIFVPTDKAFRSLLVQLGGPDKAEVKFRENPRLLSGLLLHHVIPGSFRLDELQDEMTGVSLAGTQLRVNTYQTQDSHWNDVQVATINGARIVRGLHDLSVPQGVAHALDRVMFPLPVGDLLQTLAADRERRFTRLLRLVRVAGLDTLLSGSRTHTLLAPTDKALGALPAGELQRSLKDGARARALLQRHLMAGALYGAGLRFYQERPTLATGRPVALSKADGQLKANNAHVVTPNVPATNGVLHVIDSVL